jgi:salicylate hydroxylase
LYNHALDAGARFQANSKVADIDVCSRTVTLESGQTLTADVLIGADGFTGCSRTYLLDGKIENHVRTGMLMYKLRDIRFQSLAFFLRGFCNYSALIPGEAVRADPELAHFLTSDVSIKKVENEHFGSSWRLVASHQVQNVWFGNGTACLVYEIVRFLA